MTVPDKPTSWEDLFPRELVLNAWSDDLAPLDDTVLDKSTRFVLQMLSEKHLNLTPYDDDNDVIDRPTTDRCNRVLDNLIAATNICEGRAHRADEILRMMQAFYAKVDRTTRTTISTSGTSTATASTENIKPQLDMQNQDSAQTQQLPQPPPSPPLVVPVTIPLPNVDTYFKVLRLFSMDSAADPRRAATIVDAMQERFDEHAQLDLQPTILHWNLVLSSWAGSNSYPDKAFHAAHLLQRLKNMESVVLDVSSFEHVLQACATSNESQRSKQLGAEVAVKIYSELRNRFSHLTPTPYVYTYFLRAIAHLTSSSSSYDSSNTITMHMTSSTHNERRNRAAVAAYEDAVAMGCVNEYVMDNFRQAVPLELFRSTVGTHFFRNQFITTEQLVQKLPHHAKRNAPGRTRRNSNGSNTAKE